MNQDLHSKQLEIEEVYAKNNLIPKLREYFSNHPDNDFIDLAKQAGINDKFIIDVLVQIAIHKRTGVDTLVGILKHHGDLQDVANALDYAVMLNILDYDDEKKQFIVIFDIPPQVQRELDTFQFPLPMVIQPPKVLSNRSTGYLSIRGSMILKDNHHDNDINLGHINRVNSVPYTINKTTAVMVKNKWKGLDKPSEDESIKDFLSRQKSFAKYSRTCEQVFDTVTPNGEAFHLTHRYDKRGRTYCQGYHINTQGNDWCKAVVEFADKEVIPLD